MLTAPITAAKDVETFFRADTAPNVPIGAAQDAGDEPEALGATAAPPQSEEEAASEGFVPDTEGKVNWVLGHIADARSRAARIRENAEMMAREAEREAEHLEWKFGAALQAWTRQELEGGRKKSIRLFHGVIGYRTKPAGVHVTDDVAALSWAKENLPAAVAERLDKKTLAELLLSTGEALPFATLQPEEEVFYIK